MSDAIRYTPPGPVAAAFHESNAFFRGIRGPVGSGKSSSCCVEIFSRACEQRVFNGVRSSRWAVVRNTYPELKTTTIKTWMDWFPMTQMKWDTPITGTVKIDNIGDGTAMHLEVIFLAMDRPDDIGKMKSLELTGIWFNEASEIQLAHVEIGTTRIDRYPSKTRGGSKWVGVIADTNPPDDDSWWYKWAEQDTPEGYEFFTQPGGLMRSGPRRDGPWVANPDAENIGNLNSGYDYYLRQVAGKTDDWIKVFIGGEYGTTLAGKPVYPEFNQLVHVATKPLIVNRLSPVYVGFDFGLTPAAIFTQMSPTGQLQVQAELVSEDMGIRQFYSDVVKPFMLQKYPAMKVEAVGDPAGVNRSQNDAKTCYEELLSLGLHCSPAHTNAFVARRESVAFFLTRLAGGIPGFALDPSCKVLKKGFLSGYRYERIQTSGVARFKDSPVKDRFSHPHDALQYNCLYVRGGGSSRRQSQPVEAVGAKGWT